jgi:hypothetical protein
MAERTVGLKDILKVALWESLKVATKGMLSAATMVRN